MNQTCNKINCHNCCPNLNPLTYTVVGRATGTSQIIQTAIVEKQIL